MKKSKKNSKNKHQVFTGTVIGHPKGFGFVEPDDKSDDVYLPVFEMNTVLHGDRVEVEVSRKKSSGKLSGRVTKVLDRAHQRLSGVVRSYNRKRYVQPLDKRISHDVFVDKKSFEGVNPGDIVEVKITQYPDHRKRLLLGEITHVFGDISDAEMPVTLALYKHQIPHVWSQAAQTAAEKCPKRIPETEITSRRDLRDLNFVTIDGETAKDFDDAIFVNRSRSGYALYVAIADVAQYIKANSVLDKIAYERGTSVYFPNKVVPMLPETYSNGICSLKPGTERLVMVCEVTLDEQGRRLDYQFYEAVIKSKARLTYTQVWDYLNNGVFVDIKAELQKSLKQAYQLFNKLLVLRKQRGALELEIPETFVNFNQQGEVTSIDPIIRNDAHRLIEEFMLVANVCAAELLEDKFEAGMFRVHERPDDERIADLRYFLSDFNLELPGGDRPNSEDFVSVLKEPKIKDQWKYIISTMMLRTQKQAHYSDQVNMHFALNYQAYTHFTSPIRRYPDLVVHRLLKSIIKQRRPAKKLIDNLAAIAEHCSSTERRAEEASREVVSYYKLQYLKAHVGDSFDGVITGVSSFGFFVELNGVLTSGLVHVSSLMDDFYFYDPLKQQLIGERSGKVFKIGQMIEAQISRVDLEEKKLDLIIQARGKPSSKKSSFKQKSRSKNSSG